MAISSDEDPHRNADAAAMNARSRAARAAVALRHDLWRATSDPKDSRPARRPVVFAPPSPTLCGTLTHIGAVTRASRGLLTLAASRPGPLR
jgi:hypothetical protein